MSRRLAALAMGALLALAACGGDDGPSACDLNEQTTKVDEAMQALIDTGAIESLPPKTTNASQRLMDRACER